MKKISLIAIGSELLKAYIREGNGFWLWEKIRDTDYQAHCSMMIGDDLEEMIQGIQYALDQSDILILSGGLGPTDDDLTREAIAKTFDQKLVFDDEAWLDIQAFFKARNKVTGDSNRKQALKPEGASLLKNPWGTAPAVYMKNNGKEIYAFPGVPSEFKQLAKKYILEKAQPRNADKVYKLYGIGESRLMDIINDKNIIPEGISWGTMASKDGINLRLDAESHDHPQASKAHENIERDLSEWIYSRCGEKPIDIFSQRLQKEQLRFASAESCTGGMLAQWFTAQPGSSDYFNGSIVAYQNEIKQSLLNVDDAILQTHGAVSTACVEAMAKNTLLQLKADITAAISGIAGPGGGTEEKPVGTVCIAIAHRDGRSFSKSFHFNGSRDDVRQRSCHTAILESLRLLDQTNT